jgi:hypothetical protein
VSSYHTLQNIFFSILYISFFFLLLSYQSDQYLYIMIKPKKKKLNNSVYFLFFFFSTEFFYCYYVVFQNVDFFSSPFSIGYIWIFFILSKTLSYIRSLRKSVVFIIHFPFCFVFVYCQSNLMMWQSITNEWPLNTERNFFFFLYYL